MKVLCDGCGKMIELKSEVFAHADGQMEIFLVRPPKDFYVVTDKEPLAVDKDGTKFYRITVTTCSEKCAQKLRPHVETRH